MTGMFHVYQFGPFTLDARRGALTRNGAPVPAGHRALRLLTALLARPGELVTKDELMAAGWPGMIVEDNNIPTQIRLLRRWLDDERKPHRQIVTVPGRGYRFAGEVLLPDSSLPDAQEWPPVLPPQAVRTEEVFGREQDLSRLHASLARHRLVTLTGTGGIGKTRLAAEFAAEFLADPAHRLVFLPLEDIRQGADVAARLAAALGVPASAEPERALIAALRRRGDFLVLDNCEHVLTDAAALISNILRQTDRTKILATSREPLGVTGESLLKIGPLELPEQESQRQASNLESYAAIKTFAAAARASGAVLQIDAETARPVERICRRLEGIPLALRLAGALLATHSLAVLAENFQANWRLPPDPAKNMPARQRTMEAAIAWSLALLDTAESTFFIRLGLFAGSFAPAAAAVLAPPGIDSEPTLATLAAKSLIVALPPDGGAARYRLLEPLRDFARRQIEPAQARAGRMSLLTYFGAFYEQSRLDYRFMSTTEWLLRYGDDQDNAQDVLEWAVFGAGAGLAGVADAALTLAFATQPLYLEKPFGLNMRKWNEALLALINDSTPPLLRARTLLLTCRGQNTASALTKQRAEEALEIFRQVGDQDGIGRTLILIGASLITPDEFHKAEAYLRESETHLRIVQNKRFLATSVGFQAFCRCEVPDLAGAELKAAEFLRMAQEIGCRRITQEARSLQIEIVYESGRLEDAIRLTRAQIAECRTARLPWHLFFLHMQMLHFLFKNHEPVEARRHIGEALDSYVGVFLADLAGYAAALLAHDGETEDAARLQGFASARRAYLGITYLSTSDRWSDETVQKYLAQTFDADTIARLRAEGALWDDDETILCLRRAVERR
jgi:predicted ATPase/DNA-binding winged helix-turn-helix (wHTH) protein